MLRSEAINELAAALAKAQGEMDPAVKDSLNPHFKSRYADLASVHEAIKGPLSKNGLSVCQVISVENGVHYLDSMLMHSSGQYIGGRMEILSRDKSAQALGSGITYARRYALGPLVGIASEEDDDGNQASPTPAPRRIPYPPRPQSASEEPKIYTGTQEQYQLLRQKARAAGVISKDVFDALLKAVSGKELESLDGIITETLADLTGDNSASSEKHPSNS